MAGTGVLTQPVVGLANVIRLINRFPLFAGKTVLSDSADLFIPHLHGLSAGRTINDTVEQVVKGAGITIHNGWSAVDQFLNLILFLRGHDGFMTVFNDFPFLTGNDVIGVGANAFLVRPKNQMSTFIKGIPQNVTDSGTGPVIIIFFAFGVGLDMGDRDFFPSVF